MTNLVSFPHVSDATFTITLASLASSSAGVGRQSTLIDNDTDWHRAAMVYLRIRTGTTPTINTLFSIYLILSSDAVAPIRSDGAGAADAAFTVVSTPKLGTMRMDSASTGQDFFGIFDTGRIAPLGAQWGIAVVHNTVVTLDSTEADHLKQFRYYDPRIEDAP